MTATYPSDRPPGGVGRVLVSDRDSEPGCEVLSFLSGRLLPSPGPTAEPPPVRVETIGLDFDRVVDCVLTGFSILTMAAAFVTDRRDGADGRAHRSSPDKNATAAVGVVVALFVRLLPSPGPLWSDWAFVLNAEV